MKWLIFAAFLGCASPEESTVAETSSPLPGIDCVTCNRGLTDPTCILCELCKQQRSLGRDLYAQAGCLPVDQWCGNPFASTCRIQLCEECP